MKLSKNEKSMLSFTIVMFVVLVVKSIIFDPYSPQNEAEEAFVDFAYTAAEEQFTHEVYDYGVVQLKLVDVKIEDGHYKGKMRKYALGIIPYADVIVKEGVGLED